MESPESADAIRARFAEVTDRHLAAPLPGGIVARPCEPERWDATFAAIRDVAFPRGQTVDFNAVFTDEERARATALTATLDGTPLEHRLVLLDGDTVIGCFMGQQERYGRYYMMATAIVPSHHRRGIYSAFLQRIIAIAGEMGFREIYSRHHPDNNAVLIPKLKAGFMLSTFEIAANFGLLVHLRYAFNPKLRALYAYRIEAGAAAPEMRALGIIREL